MLQDSKLDNDAGDTFLSAIQFVPECCKSQEICDKTDDTCPFVSDSLTDGYVTQEMCDKAVFKDLYILKYSSDRCKTQTIRHKYFLPILKFPPDWIQIKRLKNFICR